MVIIKKENKKKKFNYRKAIILILFLYIIFYMVKMFLTAPIKTILISGNNLVKDNEIIEISKIKDYPPIFLLNNKNIKESLLENELIYSVKITKKLDKTLKIDIVENKPLFYLKSEDKVVLSNGKQLDIEVFGIPTLINYVPDKYYNEFIENFSLLDTNIISTINYIEYSPSRNDKDELLDEQRFLLSMNDGNIVYIVPNKVESLSFYLDILSNLSEKDKKGTIYMDSSNEDNYVFVPFR